MNVKVATVSDRVVTPLGDEGLVIKREIDRSSGVYIETATVRLDEGGLAVFEGRDILMLVVRDDDR